MKRKIKCRYKASGGLSLQNNPSLLQSYVQQQNQFSFDQPFQPQALPAQGMPNHMGRSAGAESIGAPGGGDADPIQPKGTAGTDALNAMGDVNFGQGIAEKNFGAQQGTQAGAFTGSGIGLGGGGEQNVGGGGGGGFGGLSAGASMGVGAGLSAIQGLIPEGDKISGTIGNTLSSVGGMVPGPAGFALQGAGMLTKGIGAIVAKVKDKRKDEMKDKIHHQTYGNYAGNMYNVNASPYAAAYGMKFAGGGFPVEAELGEQIMMDGGQSFPIGGEKHSNGGTPISEEVVDAATYIFSDRLGYNKDGEVETNEKKVVETFADRDRKIQSKYDNSQMGREADLAMKLMKDENMNNNELARIAKMGKSANPQYAAHGGHFGNFNTSYVNKYFGVHKYNYGGGMNQMVPPQVQPGEGMAVPNAIPNLGTPQTNSVQQTPTGGMGGTGSMQPLHKTLFPGQPGDPTYGDSMKAAGKAVVGGINNFMQSGSGEFKPPSGFLHNSLYPGMDTSSPGFQPTPRTYEQKVKPPTGLKMAYGGMIKANDGLPGKTSGRSAYGTMGYSMAPFEVTAPAPTYIANPMDTIEITAPRPAAPVAAPVADPSAVFPNFNPNGMQPMQTVTAPNVYGSPFVNAPVGGTMMPGAGVMASGFPPASTYYPGAGGTGSATPRTAASPGVTPVEATVPPPTAAGGGSGVSSWSGYADYLKYMRNNNPDGLNLNSKEAADFFRPMYGRHLLEEGRIDDYNEFIKNRPFDEDKIEPKKLTPAELDKVGVPEDPIEATLAEGLVGVDEDGKSKFSTDPVDRSGGKKGSDLTLGDKMQLAGMAPGMLYNFIQGFRKADQIAAVNNPYSGDIKDIMRNRKFDVQPYIDDARLARNTFNQQISDNSSSSATRNANINKGYANYMRQLHKLRSTESEVNNKYAAEYANSLNQLGVQDVAARNLQEKLQTETDAARQQFQKAGFEQMGQGLAQFGQVKNQGLTNTMLADSLNNLVGEFGIGTISDYLKNMQKGGKGIKYDQDTV